MILALALIYSERSGGEARARAHALIVIRGISNDAQILQGETSRIVPYAAAATEISRATPWTDFRGAEAPDASASFRIHSGNEF